MDIQKHCAEPANYLGGFFFPFLLNSLDKPGYGECALVITNKWWTTEPCDAEKVYICESQRDGYAATTETEPPPSSFTAPCPENWLGFRDKCYKVSNFYESSYVSSKEQPGLKTNKLGGIFNGKWPLLRYTYETMRLDPSKIDDELYKGLTYAIKTVKDHIETT